MSLRICMIGCGAFARLCHGPAQRKCSVEDPNVELAGCCDAAAERAREYAGAFGFGRHYTDIPSMLTAEMPDAVIVAVPPAMTCRIASLVLERGIRVLIKKPPGMTTAELGQLTAAAEKGGGDAQVAFNRRYMPVMRKAREILDAEFHRPSVARIEYRMIRFNRWDADFSTTAIHALDAALFLARSPFLAARIRLQTLRDEDREAVNITVEAECVSGSRVSVDIQPVSGSNTDSAEIHAVGRSLAIKIPVSPQSAADGTLEHWRGDQLITTFSDRGLDAPEKLGVFGETRAFLDAVGSGAGFRPRLEDCRQQVALMEAIRLHQSGPFLFPPEETDARRSTVSTVGPVSPRSPISHSP